MRKKIEKQLPLMPPTKDHPQSRELDCINEILDSNPTITENVLQDLNKGKVIAYRMGANGMSADQVLRCLVVKVLFGYSYKDLAFHIIDSNTLKRFCRIGIADNEVFIIRIVLKILMRRGLNVSFFSIIKDIPKIWGAWKSKRFSPTLPRMKIIVRDGKGMKDRETMLPDDVIPDLMDQMAHAKKLHEHDLELGYGEVYLPFTLSEKYKNAPRDWGWQYVFPSEKLSAAPRSNKNKEKEHRTEAGKSGIQAQTVRPGRGSGPGQGDRACSGAGGVLRELGIVNQEWGRRLFCPFAYWLLILFTNDRKL